MTTPTSTPAATSMRVPCPESGYPAAIWPKLARQPLLDDRGPAAARRLQGALGRVWRNIHIELPRFVDRFRALSPATLARDLERAWRLSHHAPVVRPPEPRPERLVVTLTTIPSRAGTLGVTLRSLLDQSVTADRIVVAWPDRCLRSGEAYPDPSLPQGVELIRCRDEGPATKLLGALKQEADAVLVVVDDDVIYPRDFLATLLDAHRADRKAAHGWRGWQLEAGRDPRDLRHVFATGIRQPVDVDILLGTWGYLLPPGALDDAVHDFADWPSELRWVDDVWISGHLARRGVRRSVVVGRGLPIDRTAGRCDALTAGVNRTGRNDQLAIDAFRPWW